ncbi:MAG: MotA/TolQ/ExbB proton channel family protein [Alphaproteobacteria bacterium]
MVAYQQFQVQGNEQGPGPATAKPFVPAREAWDHSHRYLLALRFGLVNLVAAALFAAAYLQGWVEAVLAADSTRLSVVIFGVFVFGLGLTGRRVWQINCGLNQAGEFDPTCSSGVAHYVAAVRDRNAESRSIAAATLRLKLVSRVNVVRHIAGTLVFLGLIGTVIGFIIALSGVDPRSASDIDAVAPMVSTLIQGMSVALYTTLVGAVLNVWLMANVQILATGTVNLLTTTVELGERYARS